jgi:hypothetical protein
MEQVLDLLPILLCFNKDIDFMKSSTERFFKCCYSMDTTYSVNLPMLSSIAGGRDSTISDLRWRLIIAYRTL